MTSPIRVALVGLGDAGGHHARALRALHAQGVLVWAGVCGRDRARLDAARARRDVPAEVPSFVGLPALLASGAADAVILATPDGVHADQVVACAGAGLHVLVEKPLALDVASGQRAIDACVRAQRCLRVGYHLRHHPGHRAVRDGLREHVGALRHMSITWAWPDPAVDGWRARGHEARAWSLAALGVHALDLVLWMADEPVRDVAAIKSPAEGIDTAADVVLRLGDSIHAHVAVAVTHRAPRRVALIGEGGAVECLDTLGARGAGTIRRQRGREPWEDLPFEAADPYRCQLASFVAAARAGEPPDEAGLRARVDIFAAVVDALGL